MDHFLWIIGQPKYTKYRPRKNPPKVFESKKTRPSKNPLENDIDFSNDPFKKPSVSFVPLQMNQEQNPLIFHSTGLLIGILMVTIIPT